MVVWKQPNIALGGPSRPALFLDRDGVVVVDRHYLADPAEVELVPGAAEAMARANEAGFLLIGVSNQSGLGRGKFGPDDLAAVMTRLDELLRNEGTGFDAFHYCPHVPGEGCRCRKPAPGMLDDAATRFSWDPERSWMVGDKAADVAFGREAGLGSVLVRTGYGMTEEPDVRATWGADTRVLVANDLAAAVDLILARSGELGS
jgi:D-glycero-D-manno-heptose 1,7-bisphosphate phosphatase